MHFALRNQLSAIALIATAATAISAQPVFAESAFVTQAGKAASFARSLISSPVTVQSTALYAPPHGGATQPTPETTVPASGGNWAGTLEIGQFNHVLQAQAGSGNSSNVGILGGMHDNVDVLQHGQGLVSNLLLVGVQGFSVDVLQPPGSAPVNMLIARLPNGALLIKR
jgi:hypothetical protein